MEIKNVALCMCGCGEACLAGEGLADTESNVGHDERVDHLCANTRRVSITIM